MEDKFLMRDHYWRMLHDRRTPMDHWPYKREYEMYQAWAEDVDRKAIDTLRNALS